VEMLKQTFRESGCAVKDAPHIVKHGYLISQRRNSWKK